MRHHLFNTFRVIPAYGRQYDTIEEMIADWNNGKDFYSREGYTSCRDSDYIMQAGYDTVTLQMQNADGIICRAVINLWKGK